MERLSHMLSRYVGTAGELGGGPGHASAQRIEDRAQLLATLKAGSEVARGLLFLWGGLGVVVFGFVLYAASVHVLEPYVSVPVGCAGLFWILRRVEAIWREVRTQGLALQVALVCEDEAMLREVMTVLQAALLEDVRSRRADVGAPALPASMSGAGGDPVPRRE